MESRTVFLFGVILCMACSLLLVSAGCGGGEGKGDWKEKMKKCGDGEINIEEAFKGKKECHEENKSEERRRRSPHGGGHGKMWKNMCAAVCQWKKVGILDDSGAFSESGAQEYANKVYPESKRTDAFNKIKGCATEHSGSFSMDDKCKGYKEFKKCVFKGHMEVCGIQWGKGHKGKGQDEE